MHNNIDKIKISFALPSLTVKRFISRRRFAVDLQENSLQLMASGRVAYI
jgi:hypothetical protein